MMLKKAVTTVALMFPVVVFAQNGETIDVLARVVDSGALITTMSPEFAESGKVVRGQIGARGRLTVSAFSSSSEGAVVYGMTTVIPNEDRDSVSVNCQATYDAADDYKKIVTKVKFVGSSMPSSISCDRTNLASSGRFPTYGQDIEKITVTLTDTQ